MFVDQVKLKLIAGKGGNGLVAWRREKFLPKGGPYGGNGGRGGDIIFEADSGLYSLEVYRHKRILKAPNGKEGGTNLCQGKSGNSLTLKVPYGTQIKDANTGEILFDFTQNKSKWKVCEGGRGGRGNASFKTSTNRAPNICTPGKMGEEREIELELKLIADVGLVGMPNAGKSTLLSELTHAHVKIGAYPFTTLAPNLSYVQTEDYRRILIADIPGIIKDAHENRGLGLAFLKHIERTRALVFVLDAAGQDGRDPMTDFAVLQGELGAYDPDLLKKPFLVLLNKGDIPDAMESIAEFRAKHPALENSLFVISAKEGEGLEAVTKALQALVLDSLPQREHASTK